MNEKFEEMNLEDVIDILTTPIEDLKRRWNQKPEQYLEYLSICAASKAELTTVDLGDSVTGLTAYVNDHEYLIWTSDGCPFREGAYASYWQYGC